MTSGLPASERVRILKQEFAQIDINHDMVLSRDELFRALDDMNDGKQFDRGVAIQLYDRMDQNHDGTVTIDEFVKVFMEAEDILKQKIEKADTYLQDFQKQKQEAIQKLEELKRVEQLNQYGVMIGSILTVTVMEIQDLPLNSIQEVYVKVGCDESTFQTEIVRYTGKAAFNESFTAEIRTGMEEVQIVVLTYDPRNRDEVLGEAIVPVSRLKDQYRHDELFDLQDLSGHPVSGKIHLVLQWIHSRVKYLSDVVRKWDDHIRSQIEDKHDFERDLATLYEPFKGLLRLKSSGNQGRQPKLVQGNDFAILDRTAQQQQPKPTKKVAVAFVPTVGYDYAFYGTLIYLVFAFLAGFARNTFLDIIIGLAFILSSDSLLADFGGLRTALGGLGASVIIDIFWLSIYTSGWSGTEIQGQEGDKHSLIFSVVMSYFLFFVKIGLAYLYYNLYTADQQARPTGTKTAAII